MRVLLVDDVPELVHITKLMLEKLGHEVSTARNTAEAMSMSQGAQFDVAIIDYGLGRENGALLARDLKAAHPQLKVVLSSGTDEIPERELSLADAYYMKGYARTADLRQILQTVVENKRDSEDDRKAG
jgi:CheY-like chemotaxis protein